MRAEDKKNGHLGFLTALGNTNEGVIGGFLVLNMFGRPAEFHCTAPVRPNRAQEILYGNTLEGFLCGEQIAPALVGRSKLNIVAILTNNPSLMTAPYLLSAPLGFVFSHSKEENGNKEQYAHWERDKDGIKNESADDSAESLSGRPVRPELGGRNISEDYSFYESLEASPIVPGVDYSQWKETVRGKNHFALPIDYSNGDEERVSFSELVKRIDPFLKFIDTVEPFERIRLAVEEAQKSC